MNVSKKVFFQLKRLKDFLFKKRNEEQQRMVGAEVALMLTAVEVCIIALFLPAMAEYGKYILLPVIGYGFFYVIFIEPNS